MFRAVIVEDEKPILELMKVVVGRNPKFMIIGAFTSPFEALERFTELLPDVIFLDVEMPKLNGLELAKKINSLSKHTKIVFTTAYKHYAFEAFDVLAIDYVLKPVTPAAIDRVAERLDKHIQPIAMQGDKPGKARIACFGGFEVRGADGLLVRFPTRKAEELLAYLMCYPQRDIDKWQLVDLLWPDMSGERVLHNLHNTVYRLKKLLKDSTIGLDIQKSNNGYLLETGEYVYDLLVFDRFALEHAAGGQDIEQLNYLFSLYKGALLEGKSYMWKLPLEEKYQTGYTKAVSNLVKIESDRHDWKKAEQLLTVYLTMYPLVEEMNHSLLRIYALSGQKDLLAKHYAKLENIYRKELDIEPSAYLQEQVASWLA